MRKTTTVAVKAGVAAGAALIALACCEAFVAFRRPDMRLLEPLLYYQSADLPLHRASDDVQLHYELAPDAALDARGSRITINSLGMRDRPRAPEKPPGVFRIVCVGASNTYGAAVGDGDTYPARLEAELNSRGRRRFEVWNAGVSAYVLAQDVRRAEKIVAAYAPDLVIFQVSNRGRRPFLRGAPYARYFEADPGLYRENLNYWWPPARGWRLARAIVIAVNRAAGARGGPFPGGPPPGDADTDANIAALRGFVERHQGRVRMALLFHPGLRGGHDARLLETGLPVIDLGKRLPAGHDSSYYGVHPPARVYRWYAKEIAAALGEYGLLKP